MLKLGLSYTLYFTHESSSLTGTVRWKTRRGGRQDSVSLPDLPKRGNIHLFKKGDLRQFAFGYQTHFL
jgi:hypothetical protein